MSVGRGGSRGLEPTVRDSCASLHQVSRCYDASVRTTITLDPDVTLLIEREMAARNLRFKQVVNEALRRQLGGSQGAPPSLTDFGRDLGVAAVDLTKANQLAADLEDEELLRKMAQGR